jgi:hypothetical protein
MKLDCAASLGGEQVYLGLGCLDDWQCNTAVRHLWCFEQMAAALDYQEAQGLPSL